MDHLNNFIFVLFNSAYLVPAILVFGVLGFVFGYLFWAKPAKQLRELNSEIKVLQARYNDSLSSVDVNSTYKPAFSGPGFTAGALYGLGTVGKRFRGEEDDVSYCEELGVLYIQKPAIVDDLASIDGISERIATQLNKQGVYTVKQLETLNLRQQRAYEKRFKLAPSVWGDDFRSVDSEVALAAAYGEYEAGVIYGLGIVGKRFEAEKDKVTYCEELGVLYLSRPDQVDDLTELAGVDQRTADEMNNLGIYTFKQIETLNPRQRDGYQSKFMLTGMTWDTPVSQEDEANTSAIGFD